MLSKNKELHELKTDFLNFLESELKPKKITKKFNKHITKIPVSVMNNLINYTWPGNVRELENLIERAVILTKGSLLNLNDWNKSNDTKTFDNKKFHSMEEMQKRYITEVLEHTNLQVVGPPSFSGDDQDFARQLQEFLGVDESGVTRFGRIWAG